ncbi:hypothetical protein GOV03_02790 [Candidatus Woesearchaeota archaeon]|nr:hypothetical protein [Candidatus Woesearchaeota archaeon]
MGFVKNLFLSAMLAGTMSASPAMAAPDMTKPYTMEAERNNPVDKYAVIVVGSAIERESDNLDPMVKNSFWLNSTYVFKHLKDAGFNTYILYADGKPDFSEKVNGETISYLKKHKFKGPARWHEASFNNLENLLNKLSKKVDNNDVFVLSISTHGKPDELDLENGDYVLKPNKLTDMLSKINPGFGLVYVDACSSGDYIKKLRLKDYVLIASTPENEDGWGVRDFSTDRFFFRNMMDPASDANVDGKVTIEEALEKTKKDSIEYQARVRDYMLNEYKQVIVMLPGVTIERKGVLPEELEKYSLIPTFLTGERASDNFYLFDLFYFE